MHVALENVESSSEKSATYFDVLAAFAAKHALCTLEQRVNWHVKQVCLTLLLAHHFSIEHFRSAFGFGAERANHGLRNYRFL